MLHFWWEVKRTVTLCLWYSDIFVKIPGSFYMDNKPWMYFTRKTYKTSHCYYSKLSSFCLELMWMTCQISPIIIVFVLHRRCFVDESKEMSYNWSRVAMTTVSFSSRHSDLNNSVRIDCNIPVEADTLIKFNTVIIYRIWFNKANVKVEGDLEIRNAL